MVEGHRKWRENGLAPPSEARLAKERHRLAADPLGEFWDDCTALDPRSRVSKQELFAHYRDWALTSRVRLADQIGQHALTRAANKRAELTRAFATFKSGPWRGWRGLRLVDPEAPTEDSRDT